LYSATEDASDERPGIGARDSNSRASIARYTHRVAISNRRLISADDKAVALAALMASTGMSGTAHGYQWCYTTCG
jgi:Putative transposase